MNISIGLSPTRIVLMEATFPTTESKDQFDKQAALYAVSPIHRKGPSLPYLVDYAAAKSADRVLDVATGTGNAAFALAPFAGEVIGIDVAEQMLEQSRKRASEEGIHNVQFQVGDAENIPFDDGSFSLVIARHAPHHFRDAEQFLREVRRVLTPNGRFVMVDQISINARVQSWQDTWQRTRDTSHFLQRTIEQWHRMAKAAGLNWMRHELVAYRMEFAWWVRQAGASEEAIDFLREHARNASTEVRKSSNLEFNGDEVVAFQDQMMVVRMEPQ